MRVLIETVSGSICKSKQRLLPIYDMGKLGKHLVPKYGLAEFGQFDYTGAYKDTEYKIVIKPVYDVIIGDIYEIDDICILGTLVSVKNRYDNEGKELLLPNYCRYHYTLLQFDGIYPTIFPDYCLYDVVLSSDRKVVTVMNSKGEWGAINWERKVIIPFGKYDWIDVFKDGLARVKIGDETNGHISEEIKWGLVDVTGKEVLPPIYNNLYYAHEGVISVLFHGKEQSIYIKQLQFDTYETVKQTIYKNEEEKKSMIFDKPAFDPSGRYDYNKAALEQKTDAHEGLEDARWNTD